MTDRYPKRLIEVDLPIARISAHARREKSIRHGHISTLHIWWARRPLAACRAVTCAALWPDPADELCPTAFRQAAAEQLMAFARRVFPAKITEEGRLLQSEKHCSMESRGRWEGLLQAEQDGHPLDPDDVAHQEVMRGALLDFIADFANWDNSTVPAYLETSRALTQAAHEALGGVPGTRPLVVDPFAGGGSIPLEALRVGADAFASDLNPVAVLLNKVVLEYIPKYGQRLADEVRKWGQWVKEQAEQELAEFYPKDPDGATPIAYLWARTILSEAPGQGDVPVEVPLMRTLFLSKRKGSKRALRWVRDDKGQVATIATDIDYANGKRIRVRQPVLEMFVPERDADVEEGTVARGSATCPVTGFTTPVKSVREQLGERSGGAKDARLLCVVTSPASEKGRTFRLPEPRDMAGAETAQRRLRKWLERDSDVSPTEELDVRGIRHTWSMIYGLNKWSSYFSDRQLLVLATLTKTVRSVRDQLSVEEDPAFADAIQTILGLAISRFTDICNSLCGWSTSRAQVIHALSRQAIPMVWDFAEPNVLADGAGNYDVTLSTMIRVLKRHFETEATGTAAASSATQHPLPDDSAQAYVTDPPYYDAVPYAYLSDFFYVWLRRTVGYLHQGLFDGDAVPKDQEIVVDRPHELSDSDHDIEFYERELQKAFCDGRRILHPSGVGVIVFASKTTASWEAILQAVVDAGLTVTASWPVDTEREARVSAHGQARLGSSVHLVCRPREEESGALREEVGEWRDVLSELPQRIHEWMPRLAAEGVVGADAIFACLGPALEIFSRYSRVEKASGEAVPLREYLEQVWAAVSTEALSMIFKDADAAGLEPDARLTAMWLWTLGAGAGESNGNGKSSDDKVTASTGYTLEFDAARKIAQGLGIHLEQSESIVEVKGDKARMLPVSERTRHLFGKEEATATTARGRKKKKETQRSLFEEMDALEAEAETITGELKPQAGETVLDRVHQSMILFASGRGEALRRFLVDDGAGNDARFWKLAQSLSALYPKDTDEKRWVDGVLARKKGLGL